MENQQSRAVCKPRGRLRNLNKFCLISKYSKSHIQTCSLYVEAEALRKFSKINLFDEVGPRVRRLDSLLGHKHPEERIETDLASALLREREGNVVKPGIVDWTGFTIFVGQLAGQQP